MLDKVIALPFSLFLIFLFAFFAVTGMAMFTQWSMVQNEAQYIAASMGKWGGYTQEAEDSVKDMADRLDLSRSSVNVEVSDVGPAPWGMPVTAEVTVPFDFKVGKYDVGSFHISGLGNSVSTCIDAYAVSYIYP